MELICGSTRTGPEILMLFSVVCQAGNRIVPILFKLELGGPSNVFLPAADMGCWYCHKFVFSPAVVDVMFLH